jgi:methionyl-tRNA formyltransferase
MALRIAFLGNGPFAAPALKALHDDGQSILLVVARPDRPQGKHLTIEQGPVAALANELRLPLEQPESVNTDEFVAKLASLDLDLLVVADFGQILSSNCLSTARLGGVNIHGSLLPKYRGAAPVAWAIYHGDANTGVSILRMTPKMDAGGVVAKEVYPIPGEANAAEVEAELSRIGARLIVDVCRNLERGSLPTSPQDSSQVTMAPKLTKEHGRLRWDRTSRQVVDQFRAMTPWPGAFVEWTNGKGQAMRLKVLKVSARPRDAVHEAAVPGEVLSTANDVILVAAVDGAVAIEQLQPAGGKPMSAVEFLRGRPIPRGATLH